MKLTGIEWIVLIAGIIILIWLIIWVVSNTFSNTPQNIEPYTLQNPLPNKEFKLYYFYHPSCGYCNQFMSTWEKIKQKYNDKNIYTIDVSKPENENLSFYYNINKYPTIILLTQNKNIEYTGDRTIEDINHFIAKHN